jgi:hypothetical protein
MATEIGNNTAGSYPLVLTAHHGDDPLASASARP